MNEHTADRSGRVTERIRASGGDLTSAERRVAEAVLDAPQLVGFGTVAELAKSAAVGAATVVRLCGKLGFDGYSQLQAAVQDELLSQLRPAVERIETANDGAVEAHTRVEISNVERTLAQIDEMAFTELISRLADLERDVVVVSGEDTAGVAHQFLIQLDQIRPGVTILAGSTISVDRQVAVTAPTATAIIVDLRRYERWVLDTHRMLADRGVWSAAISDNALSPLANLADVAFDVAAASNGPFDSHVGTLALLNAVITSTAAELRESAAERLRAIEAAWNEHNSLEPGH